MPSVTVEVIPRRQFRDFLTTEKRWSVIVAHRRAGKTVACIQKLVMAALQSDKKRPRFAYIAPLLKQAKAVAWDYLRDYASKIPGAAINISELRADFPNGSQIRLYGADNPDSLRGIYVDGVVLDEAADMSPRIFPEILRPALADRGGWCVWIGTPKGVNEFHDLWERAQGDPDFYTLMLKASETGLVAPAELKAARKEMTEAQWLQEFECSFLAAVIGAYYGHEMEAVAAENRIVPRLYDKTAGLVNTAWDLGAGDDTVIVFYQTVGLDIRVIDYYAANGWGLDHYAGVLRERGYAYGRHYLPHDVEIRVLSGGEVARTRRQTLESLGVPVSVVPKWSLEDGINAVRRVLPRMWFDAEKAEHLVKALRQYRREWDDTRKVFYERPLHDWASHPADAVRYLAISVEDPRAKNRLTQKAPDTSWIV